VTKAKGRWPFRASGIPTTQHSVMSGCVEMACSIEPVLLNLCPYENKITREAYRC
jgi:hypothetical protein